MRIIAAALIVIATSVSVAAQPPANRIYARDGWEAFSGVYYEGGDATQPKRLLGMLVLTDSTIALHPCVIQQCYDTKKGAPFREPPFFSIPLTSIKDIVSSSRVRGADTMGKVFLGGLASDRPEDFVALVYETKSSVEAPLFKTAKAQSAAIDAKLRFRLKRLGVELNAQP